jgi:hypothetical protein
MTYETPGIVSTLDLTAELSEKSFSRSTKGSYLAG